MRGPSKLQTILSVVLIAGVWIGLGSAVYLMWADHHAGVYDIPGPRTMVIDLEEPSTTHQEFRAPERARCLS